MTDLATLAEKMAAVAVAVGGSLCTPSLESDNGGGGGDVLLASSRGRRS